jgi:hypothetical protein
MGGQFAHFFAYRNLIFCMLFQEKPKYNVSAKQFCRDAATHSENPRARMPPSQANTVPKGADALRQPGAWRTNLHAPALRAAELLRCAIMNPTPHLTPPHERTTI